MKKLVLTCLIAVAAVFTTNAQVSVGLKFNTGFPTNSTYSDLVSTGLGAGIEGIYAINDNINVGLEVDFLSFAAKDNSFISLQLIPITAKAEYMFMDQRSAFRPYAGLGLGFVSGTVKADFSDLGFGLGEESTSTSGLSLSPRIGGTYALNDQFALNLNINYTLMLTQSAEGESVDDKTDFLGIGIGVRYAFD